MLVDLQALSSKLFCSLSTRPLGVFQGAFGTIYLEIHCILAALSFTVKLGKKTGDPLQ